MCRLDNDTHVGLISYVYGAQSLCLRQRIQVPGVGQHSFISYTEVPQLEVPEMRHTCTTVGCFCVRR